MKIKGIYLTAIFAIGLFSSLNLPHRVINSSLKHYKVNALDKKKYVDTVALNDLFNLVQLQELADASVSKFQKILKLTSYLELNPDQYYLKYVLRRVNDTVKIEKYRKHGWKFVTVNFHSNNYYEIIRKSLDSLNYRYDSDKVRTDGSMHIFTSIYKTDKYILKLTHYKRHESEKDRYGIELDRDQHN